MSSLGFTSKEQRNLGLLVHLMTTNPKILYSPIGSQVDKVIQKACKQHSLSCICTNRFALSIKYEQSFCHNQQKYTVQAISVFSSKTLGGRTD